MAALCAERIIAAIVTLLTGGGTGAADRVYGQRVDELLEAENDIEVPALGVVQDADASVAGENGRYRSNVSVMDSMIAVRIQAATRGDTSAIVRAALNDLRREVHALMMQDNALGLPFVVDILPIGAERPELNGEADRISGVLEIAFDVHYRYNISDASVGVGE